MNEQEMGALNVVGKDLMFEKPPLGLTPRFIVDEKRLMDINNAMLRYAIAIKEVPQERQDERDELVARLNAFYNRDR